MSQYRLPCQVLHTGLTPHNLDGVQHFAQVGQELTGRVKGIQKFGVFVDIGAQSDGLVHISQMSNSFVSDPNELAKVGDTVSGPFI